LLNDRRPNLTPIKIREDDGVVFRKRPAAGAIERQGPRITPQSITAFTHHGPEQRSTLSLPSMPDLSLPDFSDTTGRLLTEFNTFAQQVGDALPILEWMGYEVTTFKVTWGLPPAAHG
jgi:hypothetical protein